MSTHALGLDVLRELRRPFPREVMLFRIDGKPNANGVARCVAYIDARAVIDRLNTVLGMAWSDEYEDVAGGVRCRLTIMGTTRADVGEPMAQVSGPKGTHSDALKRAAVKFGIGRFIKALPHTLLTLQDPAHLRSWESKDQQGKPVTKVGISFKGQDALRLRYLDWTRSERAVARYGEVLELDDDVDQVPDEEEESMERQTPEQQLSQRPPRPAEMPAPARREEPSPPQRETPEGTPGAAPGSGFAESYEVRYFDFLKQLRADGRLADYKSAVGIESIDRATWFAQDHAKQVAMYTAAEDMLKVQPAPAPA